MARHQDVSHQVMEIVLRSPGGDLEEVVLECPDLTWNQVFLELDRLSRAGHVTLKEKGWGLYTVTPRPDTATESGVDAIH